MLPSVMKILYFSALIGVLAACGSPPPATLSQWYFSERAKAPGFHIAMAATDLRNWNGSPQDDRSLRLSSFPTGFGVYSSRGNTIEEAERGAISGCNQRWGRNACYIYFRNADYVRFGRREAWLQSNSSARRAIAAEKKRAADQAVEQRRLNEAEVMVAPVQTGPTAKDLAEAEALFRLSDMFGQMAQPRQPQTCTTMWNGIAWVTRC